LQPELEEELAIQTGKGAAQLQDIAPYAAHFGENHPAVDYDPHADP
jgi:hypothetical protein